MKENQTFEKIFGPYKDELTDEALRKKKNIDIHNLT